MKDMFNQRQRYSLRKYSFGVASVLLGVTLLSASQTAQAEEVNSSAPTSTTITRADTDKPEAVDVSATITTTEVIPESGVGADTSAVVSTITSESSFLDSEIASSSALETSEVASEVTSTSASTVGIPARAVATPATASMPRTAGFSGVVGTSTFTTGVTTVSASDANDPMPTGEYTNTSIPNIATDPDVPKNLSVGEVLAGNTVTAPSLAGTLGALAINDARRRIALIASVSGQDGQTLERYYRASVDFDTKNYTIDEFDSSFNQLNSYSVVSDGTTVITPFGVGADKPTITLRSKSDEGVTFIFTRAENWDTVNKYSIKVDYAAVMRSILPTYFSADSSDSNVNQSEWNQSLPFPSEVRINYLEKGSGTQLANSNVIPALIGDHYVTIDATDSNFFTQFQNKGYELVESPVYANGTINATYWGGKGFVALNEIINTVNGQTRTFVVRRTVVNEDGDITIEMWDKASGVKLPVKGYTTTAGTPEYTDYDTVFVSKPIRPSDETLTSSSIYTKVDFIWKDENGLIGYIGPNRVPHSDIINDVNSASGTVLISNWTNSWKPSGGELTYWYTRPKGDVTVEYYIEGSNTKIATDQKAADQVSVKETYDASTSALRPATITYNGQTYRLVLDSNNEPVLKSGSAAVTGTVEKATQSVQYQYRLVQRGSVDVVYKAEDGTILEALSPVVTNSNEGTAYTTSQKTFAGYTFKELESGSAATSGVVVGDQTLHVVYVYSPIVKTGSVDVVYKAEDGTILEALSPVVTNANEGTAYTTSQKTFAGYTFKELESGSAATSGVVVGDQTLHVVYVYSPVVRTGSVDVVYKAEDGTILEALNSVVTNANEGTAYTTSQKTFAGYTFKELESGSAATSGVVVGDQTLHVVYVYSANPAPVVMQKADITIVAVDAAGNAMTVARQSGTTTTAITDGILEVSSNLQGTAGSSVQTQAQAAGFDYQALIAKYQQLGYQVVSGSYTGTGSLASKGTMTEYTGAETFDNDTASDQHFVIKLTPIVVPFEPNQPVTPGQTVPGLPNNPTYPTPDNTDASDPNRLKETVTRTVSYFTEDKDGNNKTAIDQSAIASKSDTLYFRRTGTVNLVTGEVVMNGWTITDANYNTASTETTGSFANYTSPVHTGFILKSDTYRAVGAHTGVQATDADLSDEVIYVPIAKYVPQWPTGDTPTTPWTEVPYTNDPTDPTKIVTPTDPGQSHIPYVPGYTPQDPNGNPLQPVDPSDPTKGYIPPVPTSATDDTVIPYTRNGEVLVKYVDENGKTLQADRVDTSDAPVGTAYDTNEAGENPTRITSTDGKIYELVRVDGNERGQVVSGTTTVTYVYRDVTPKRGNVLVKYVSDTGVTLQADRTDLSNATVGTSYNTNEAGENPVIITTADGSRYGKIRVIGNETGSVVEGDTVVTYVYTLLSSPKGSVVVEYRDEEGNVLKTSRVDLADAPVGTRYNTNEAGENPQYIDAADGIRYELVNHRGNETGSVVEGTTTVVYIYRAMGEVVVDYVDEFGNKLINSRTAQGWSSQGTAYDASTGNPQVIYRNGVRYEVERVVGQEKGKVGKGRTTVTYIYRKVDEPTTPTGPKTPGQPATPTGNVPGQSGRSGQKREDSATGRASANQQTSESVDDQEQLPETGDEGNATAAVGAGLLASLMAGLALSRKRKED